MRVLWLTTRPPYPANAGGKIAVYWRVRELAERGHTVRLVAPSSGETQATLSRASQHLRSWCADVLFTDGPLRLDLAIRLARGEPWGAARRAFGEQDLDRVVGLAASSDVLLVDQSGMVPAARQVLARLPGRLPAVVYQFADAAESLRLTARSASRRRRGPLLAEAAAYARLDRSIVADARIDQIGFVSSEELRRVSRQHPGAAGRLSFHPLPYPFDQVPVRDARVRRGETIDERALFVASFDDPGNRVAADWLVEEILPLLRETGITIDIVGRKASTLPYGSRAGLKITSDPADLNPFYDRASVCLVPVRGGGGVRLKLLEAVARAVPVVTTTLGVEGTTFSGGELAIADEPTAFAQAINRLTDDPGAGAAAAHRAREMLIEHHDPAAVAARLETTLERARGQARRAPADAPRAD